MGNAIYGVVLKGNHKGEVTLCRAQDMSKCTYHSSHQSMSKYDAQEFNERVIASRMQSNRAPINKHRYDTMRRAAFSIMAVASITATLSACSPTSSSVDNDSLNDIDTSQVQDDYSKMYNKAKDSVNSDSVKKLKDKAKELANSDKAKDAKSKIEDYLNSLDESSSTSTDTSLTTGSNVFGNVNKSSALSELSSLHVQSAQNVNYNRTEWKTWDSVGKSCWNVREQIVSTQAQSVKLAADGCSIESVSLKDPYTGNVMSSTQTIDVDHVVPLGYVASHGGQSWSSEKKEQYANDTTAGHLIAVSSFANRSKGDKGPSEWMPSTNQCAYAEDFVGVLQKWGISVDPSDASYLQQKIASCE
jgi:hypothetical protein